MGYVQAAYGNPFILSMNKSLVYVSHPGAGALVAPLVSTQFAQMRHWSFHYLVSLGVTALNTIFLGLVFRAKTQDGE
jgi:hypothetical protein